jgi:hypothetical protein
MIAGLSVVAVIGGAAVAYMADAYMADGQRYRSVLQTLAGFLLLGGFGLLGYALDCAFGWP